MTDQQRKAVEEEFSRFSVFHRLRLSDVSEIYEKGMLEVLNNPDRYGLGTWPVLAEKLEILTEENARLREALQYLMEGVRGLPPLTAIAGTLVDHCDKAQKALKGDDTCKH